MTEKHENLTHEEVWDDSALIDSWNQALDEYKVNLLLTVSRCLDVPILT